MKINLDKKILLYDSEQKSLQAFELLLREIGVKTVLYAWKSSEALEIYQNETADLCLITLNSGEAYMSGIDLAEKIRALSAAVPIVFLSELYTDAVYSECRRLRPFSFMGKELSKFKLYQIIDMAFRHSVAISPVADIPLFIENNPRRYFFKAGESYKPIPVEEIRYFFTENNSTFAKTDKSSYAVNVMLKALEEELGPCFIRTHKTYIINMNHIESINPTENSIRINGDTLPIGHAYRKAFFNKIPLFK